MKKFKIISYIILLIVLVILALTVYTSATQSNEEDEKGKATSEIKYLDSKLVDLFNTMNNIETRNYKIYTTQIKESDAKENTSSGESSSKDSNASTDTNTSANADSASGSDSSDSSTGNASNNTSTQNSGDNYEMKESGILTSDRSEIDWTLCKNELELIYTSISTITLDLYGLNIAQDDILNFNKEVDNLTVSVEAEDKQATLDNLVKIYEYIPKFAKNIVNDTLYKTILETKWNVFKAYAKLDSKNWEQINTDMTDAINVYTPLLTNVEIESNKQASVNKGYVMLNELKNAANIQNESVFLIKYKNLLEEINNM